MPQFRTVSYWFLLLVSTIFIGSVAFYLLSKEASRLEQLGKSSLLTKTQTVADNMDLIVSEVKTGLMANLEAFPQRGIEETLRQWRAADSLVGDVFLWSMEDGFILGAGFETHFRREGQFIWRTEEVEMAQNESVLQQIGEEDTEFDTYSNVKGKRRQIRKQSLDNMGKFNSFNVQPQFPFLIEPKQGWYWSMATGTPALIGWFQINPTAPVRGVIVYQKDLISHLEAALPTRSRSGERFELSNRSDKFYLGRASFDYEDFSSLTSVVTMGSELPGFSLKAYSRRGFMLGPGFLWLGSVLIGILMVAMLVGGSMLYRQARLDALEAARKTNFVSNVSHELKTPLTTIRMYSELLGEERVRSQEKRKLYLNTIISETHRLTRLVNNVLDFSRLERGAKKYNLERIQLNGLVSSIVETQQMRLQEVEMELISDISDTPLFAMVDRDAIEQVILNLLDNALKYAAEGKWVKVSLVDMKGRTEIIVSDRGPGIPSSQHKRIFNTFYRVDDSLTANQPGCGLGLSIARRLMEDMGGELCYEPNRPHGASFRVILF